LLTVGRAGSTAASRRRYGRRTPTLYPYYLTAFPFCYLGCGGKFFRNLEPGEGRDEKKRPALAKMGLGSKILHFVVDPRPTPA
jgi:hypothetical protein